MALTGFLRIPDIEGESRQAGHEGEIDIHGLSWGIARGATRSLAVTKGYDVASPYLMLAAAQGGGFDEIVLTLPGDGGFPGPDSLSVTMQRVSVSTYDIESDDGDTADAPLRERVTFTFDRVQVLYRGGSEEHRVGFEVLRPR